MTCPKVRLPVASSLVSIASSDAQVGKIGPRAVEPFAAVCELGEYSHFNAVTSHFLVTSVT